MLVLTRAKNEAIMIGDDIRIEVVDVVGGGRQVRIGISAPRSTPVFREEVYRAIQVENERGSAVSPDALAAAASLVEDRRRKQP
ncbi:csrA: carbon storage regulator [Gaiella occulta]|uniref:Translational regulator CsrA n=1 Tax=Gaiella occulta TaxID=1002870 RepID=A0A7M2Z2N0_9ACTN|nr:carbon storage regulator CsrA [Gaiella occulta]RDI76013.1 csrA: carbon storage regulator [Gaiella occulta]